MNRDRNHFRRDESREPRQWNNTNRDQNPKGKWDRSSNQQQPGTNSRKRLYKNAKHRSRWQNSKYYENYYGCNNFSQNSFNQLPTTFPNNFFDFFQIPINYSPTYSNAGQLREADFACDSVSPVQGEKPNTDQWNPLSEHSEKSSNESSNDRGRSISNSDSNHKILECQRSEKNEKGFNNTIVSACGDFAKQNELILETGLRGPESSLEDVGESSPLFIQSPAVFQENRQKNSSPSISLVPLSFLIDPKLQGSETEPNDKEKNLDNVTSSSSEVEPNPNATCSESFENATFKKPELISKKLIHKVANMDKTNIRNVINNPILKFDIALKMHAKKRLREEIRKQLRSMNFENRQITGDGVMRPDEYVDTEKIPAEMLRQFESAFNMNMENDREFNSSTIFSGLSQLTSAVHSSEENLSDTGNESFLGKCQKTNQSAVNLRTKLLNLEFIKQQAILRRCRPESPDSDDDVYIIESDKESITIAPDESSTDSSATSTTCTSSGSVALPQQKLKEKFLNSFKRDILPNLPDSVRREYENSSGKDAEIAKIYNMCLEKLQTLERKNGASSIRFNASNSDEALNFLVENIRTLFAVNGTPHSNYKGIEARKHKEQQDQYKSSGRSYVKRYYNGRRGCDKRYKKPATETRHERDMETHRKQHNTPLSSTHESTREPLHRKEDASSSGTTTTKRESHVKSNVGYRRETPQKDERSSYRRSSSYHESKRKRTPSPSRSKRSDVKTTTSSNSSLTDNNGKHHANKRKHDEIIRTNDVSNNPPKKVHKESNTPNEAHSSQNERSWRSPGEKKCIEPSVSQELIQNGTPIAIQTNSIIATTPDSTGKEVQIQNPSRLGAGSSEASEEASPHISSSGDINIQARLISIDSLKTLDNKLIELNQKKMDIEKKIIDLQREKMELDLTVMKLQNERFALISSVVSNPNGYMSGNSNLQNWLLNANNMGLESNNTLYQSETPHAATKAKSKIVANKKKPDLVDKLKNGNKRCDRDMLIEYSASTLIPDSSNEHYQETHSCHSTELAEKVSTFTMPTRRKPVQVVSPEKPKSQNHNGKTPRPTATSLKLDNKTKSSQKPDENMLPVLCAGQSVNVNDNSDSSDCDDNDKESPASESISDRKVSNGQLKGFRLPIVRIIGVEGYILCASEDGNIYKFDSCTRQLISTFAKHTESITEMCVDGDGYIYSTSLDGYMKKTSVENFGLELQSLNLHEPLQAVNLCWNAAFVGSRWGNIFKYDVKKNKLNESMLCSVGCAIIAIKATKEGPRRIIIISSKGERIHLRDASSGLLLRTIHVPENQNISNIALNGGLLYCGSNGNKLFIYDFTTGNEINTFTCGNGAVSVRLFRNKLLFIGCYDGFIYVLDKQTGEQIGRFSGAGKMILALEIIGEKILTSSKESTVHIIDIPSYILTHIK